MKNKLAIFMLIGGIVLFALAFSLYKKSERIKSDTDILRDIATSQSGGEDMAVYEPEPKPLYDPSDIDQTPPGVTPFISATVCLGHWGNHLRQYCGDGDNTALELIEGGDDQTKTMRVLTLCLNELLIRMDTYDTDERPMDSAVAQNETNRKKLACELTSLYGDSPAFNDGSVYYMTKEHMESGNINRLESR